MSLILESCTGIYCVNTRMNTRHNETFAAYAPPPNMKANRIPTVITAITGKTINTSKIMTAHVNFPITYS